MPRTTARRGQLSSALKRGGYVASRAPEQIACTHFGGVTARPRCVQLRADGRHAAPSPAGLEPVGRPCAEPRGPCQLRREAGYPAMDPLPPERGAFQVDPRISITGDRMLPKPCGARTPRGKGQARRMAVHDPRGPRCTARAKPDPVRGYANTMVAEAADSGWRVRPPRPKEVWRAQGGPAALWDPLGRAGVAVADRMRAAARALPRRAARWAPQWAERGLRGAEELGGDARPVERGRARGGARTGPATTTWCAPGCALGPGDWGVRSLEQLRRWRRKTPLPLAGALLTLEALP